MIDLLQTKNIAPPTEKTTGYMNESGIDVKKLVKSHGIKPEELLLVHDDSDILLGEYKLSFNRNAGGHKGVDHTIKQLKTKTFWRLRIGIRPKSASVKKIKAMDLVLKTITPANDKKLQEVFKRAYDEIKMKSS